MNLGNFSVSLNVKDLQKSVEFYETIGFEEQGGDGEQWCMLKNNQCVITLFQGMLNENIMTFNPRWNSDAEEIEGNDIREIEAALKAKGIEPTLPIKQGESGPAHFIVKDPDGNTLLFDQHV